jgi:hypothetical protein
VLQASLLLFYPEAGRLFADIHQYDGRASDPELKIGIAGNILSYVSLAEYFSEPYVDHVDRPVWLPKAIRPVTS